jgi:hypothetical protein
MVSKSPPFASKHEGIKNGLLGAEVFAEPFFKLAVQGLRSTNKTN